MTFFANSHGLCLDSCPLLGCLAHRYQIPEHFPALFALKHANVPLLSTHLFMKAFEQICRPDQRGQGLRNIDRQVGSGLVKVEEKVRHGLRFPPVPRLSEHICLLSDRRPARAFIDLTGIH
jgi:hypothetical protein